VYLITREQEVKKSLKAKGILVGINDGLLIEDEKTGDRELLTLDNFKMFLDKVININITESTKTEIQEEGD
jgi:hypothetical protein